MTQPSQTFLNICLQKLIFKCHSWPVSFYLNINWQDFTGRMFCLMSILLLSNSLVIYRPDASHIHTLWDFTEYFRTVLRNNNLESTDYRLHEVHTSTKKTVYKEWLILQLLHILNLTRWVSSVNMTQVLWWHNVRCA